MKLKRESENEILSFLGEGVEFKGELSFASGIRVDGIVNGKIHSESCLVVGPKGKVNADIDIRRVSINGEFRGSIHASDRVEIHKEGRVYGDITTPCLIIEAGAVFEGRCNMQDRQPASPAQTAPAAAAQTAGDSRG